MKPFHYTTILGAAALLTLAISARGASERQAGGQEQWMKEVALNQLHHINQKEIELSKLALDKADSQQVKSAAQKMQSDHQALENRVQEVAKAQNIRLQKFSPSTYEKVTTDRLKDLSGSQFDQVFMRNMQMGHQAALQDLQRINSQARDPQIKSLVSDALPKIRRHQELSAGAAAERGVAGEGQQQEQQKQ